MRCAGLASTTTRARSTRCSAWTRYHEVAEAMIAAGTAYRCYSTPEELDAMREAQRARGEKTHYDGRWRPEPGKTLPLVPVDVKPVVRFRNPSERRGELGRPRQGADPHPQRRDRRPHHPAQRRRADLQLRGRGRRLGHGHHARLSRRRAHQQHAVADQHLPCARRAAAAVWPLPDHPRRRRPEAVQAARRGQRDGLRRGGLPARGDAQLPGAPGLEPWRRRAVQRASRWCSGSTAATWPRARRSGTRPSSPGSTRTT